MLIDAIRYIVLAEGSFASPLIKTARMVRFIAKKHRISIERSDLEAGIFAKAIERYPATKRRQLSKINLRIVFVKVTREFRII
jgi:hypothetical protein